MPSVLPDVFFLLQESGNQLVRGGITALVSELGRTLELGISLLWLKFYPYTWLDNRQISWPIYICVLGFSRSLAEIDLVKKL